MKADTAVFSIYAQENKLGLFLLTRDELRYYDSPESYQAISSAIKELQITLTNPYYDFYRKPSQRLSKAVLKPVQKYLQGITTLLYCPDGLFSAIPLGVLQLENHYLTEQTAIVRVASLRSITQTPRKQKLTKRGISCVDPAIAHARLPFQGDTGKLLEQLFHEDLKALTAEQCTPAKLEMAINNSKDASFLHIGAHGVYYLQDPMRSGIYLSAGDHSDSGALWDANAIGAIDMSHIELVTLASCKTGLIDSSFSRDIFGIQRTLLFSGAQAVIAPLWSVDDQATSTLIQQFYQAYELNRQPEQSLKNVQQQLINSEQYSHPFFWAGFVLTRAMI